MHCKVYVKLGETYISIFNLKLHGVNYSCCKVSCNVEVPKFSMTAWQASCHSLFIFCINCSLSIKINNVCIMYIFISSRHSDMAITK